MTDICHSIHLKLKFNEFGQVKQLLRFLVCYIIYIYNLLSKNNCYVLHKNLYFDFPIKNHLMNEIYLRWKSFTIYRLSLKKFHSEDDYLTGKLKLFLYTQNFGRVNIFFLAPIASSFPWEPILYLGFCKSCFID